MKYLRVGPVGAERPVAEAAYLASPVAGATTGMSGLRPPRR
ncbi:hypothetical protein ACIBSW_35510 [Actinoplanes sp. NPDC049668]